MTPQHRIKKNAIESVNDFENTVDELPGERITFQKISML